MIKNKFKIFINCFFPVFLGGIIYISFRSENLMMFTWFKKIGINNLIFSIRIILNNQINNLPDWLIYSLPDALWTYSFIYSILFVWKDNDSLFKYLWIILVFIFTIGSELGQLINFVPGTFDKIDLLLSSLAFIFPFIIIKRGGLYDIFQKK